MTNPSHEYMRRIRREEQAKLLGLRRERVTKALDAVNLHVDTNAMLAQIAYAIHPHVGAWDEDACDHLRNVLAELIGDAREAASGVESHSPCGASGCHCGNESEEVSDGMAGGGRGMREDSGDSACWRMDYSDVHQEVVGYQSAQYDVLGNERHKAVCALREWKPEISYSTDGMGEIHIRILYQILGLGGAMMMDGADAAKAVRDRLVHLLGGDQSHDSSPMRQENETGITDELREYVRDHETTTMMYATLPPQLKEKPTPNGDKLLAIADEIDERAEKLAHDVEMWRNRAEDMCMECDELQVKLGESQAERDELQGTIADLNEQLESCKAKCLRYKTHIDQMQGGSKRLRKELREQEGTYLDLLRDAAMDYKALQDKLYHAVKVCQRYTEARCA